jgi:hypothetical protein
MQIDFHCYKCGEDLDLNLLSSHVEVIPCKHCLEDERTSAYDDGYHDAMLESERE